MSCERILSLRFLRQCLTFAMVCCFAAGGWLILKPALRPSTAVGSTGSAELWTTRAIEDVTVGDLVLARDEHGAEIGWKPVKEVYRRTSKHLRHLTFRDASGKEQHFETTDEHPFWSLTAKKFVNAGDLKTGDQVTSAPPRQGNPDLDHPSAIQILTATHRDEHPNGITVYNFQVEDFHTYFVAARGATGPPVLVHNANYRTSPDPRTRPGYDPGDTHKDHILAECFGGQTTPSNLRDIPAGMNLRKGGLEGSLRRYEDYLIRNGMDPADARSVIQDEIDSLGRDVIATPMGLLGY